VSAQSPGPSAHPLQPLQEPPAHGDGGAAEPGTPDFSSWTWAEAARHRALVVRHAGSGRHTAELCVDRSCEPALLEAVQLRTQLPLRTRRVSPACLDAWLEQAERTTRALDGRPTAGTDAGAGQAAAHDISLQALLQQTSPAVRMLDAVLHDALKDGASDVHLETHASGLQVRMRLDGVMLDVMNISDSTLAEHMISRLKVMAELDIGERRLPQDGRFAVRSQDRSIDCRLSIMPSVHGEDAVVRVLDRRHGGQGDGRIDLQTLGFDAQRRTALLALARAPHGMLLVTGPTGSGKTTTLYALLAEVHDGTEKIITIEDPVEYALPGVVQIPVNERKGLGFARGLRSILRHDPDRILVGEIRDAETAQIAVQAALTGHLVFSTVHANHSFDVIGRFAHMGLDLHNVLSSLNAVVAQRLLRRLCTDCATPGPGPRHPVGCPRCRGTGYRGRMVASELLVLDDELRDLLASRAPLQRIKEATRAKGLRPLAEEVAALVAQGVTSEDEVVRVVGPG